MLLNLTLLGLKREREEVQIDRLTDPTLINTNTYTGNLKIFFFEATAHIRTVSR